MITMAKADKLISKARSWSVGEELSDIAIARKLHEFNKDLGYIVSGFSLFVMMYSENKTWELAGIIVGFSGLLWACYLLHLSRSFSQIREMFDAAGPQSLQELKSSSLASSGTSTLSSNP